MDNLNQLPFIQFEAAFREQFYAKVYSECYDLVEHPLTYNGHSVLPNDYYPRVFDDKPPYFGFFIHLATQDKHIFDQMITARDNTRPCSVVKRLDRRCGFECASPSDIIHIGSEERFRCVYRAMYLPSIRHIVDNADNMPATKVWEETEFGNTKVYYLFEHGTFRYLIQLLYKMKTGCYYIVRAYPVFLQNELSKIRRSYEQSKK